jgi:hypothetical protein
MRRMLDEAIYYATLPIRLFGRSRGFRIAFGAACIAAAFFAATLWALDRYLPEDSGIETALTIMNPPPPLQAVTRWSYVIAPVAVALSAIRRNLDAAAPRELAGKDDNPVSSLLSKADIGIIVARGALVMNGQPNDLAITTPLNGTLRVTGQIATQAGNITSSITGLLDKSIRKDVGKLTSKVLDQRAEVRGNVVVHARPAFTANWRLEPNLTAEVTLADSAVTLAGFKINVSSEAKLLIDREVNAQIANLQTRLRTIRSSSAPSARNGPRCAARSRSAATRPACPACGWRCARSAPPPRSRRSTRAMSRSPSVCRPTPASRRRRASRTARSRPSSNWCRRWKTANSRSACRSTCRSASSTNCWKRSSRGIATRKTAARRSRSRCAAHTSPPPATGC